MKSRLGYWIQALLLSVLEQKDIFQMNGILDTEITLLGNGYIIVSPCRRS